MRRGRAWPGWALVTLAAATRLPLWGATQGEPDSGCILVDIALWIRHWPHLNNNNFVYGYFPILSPGYFAFWGRLGRWLAIPGPQLAYWVNGVNLLCELAVAPLLYLIARRFMPEAAAWWAAALYLLAPAYWWLGLEAHPEGPMILFALLALDQFLRKGRWHAAAAVGLMSVALLLRCDGILLLPAFAACAWLQAEPRWRTIPRALAGATLLGLASGLLFMLGQAAILGQSLGAEHAKTVSVVTRFAIHSSLFHQLVPLVTAPGPAVFGFAAMGWGLLLRRRPQYLALAAAAVPGILFWMPITGNVVRHVVALWLPLMWAGCAGWWMAARRYAVPAALAAVAINFVILPANSNVNVYPSPDVFVSHHL